MKKQTKKEIYAGFGIEYKAGRINYPIYGMKRPILKNGNAKVGKNVWTESLLPTNKIITGYARLANVVNAAGLKEIKGTCNCTCKNEKGETACYACTGCYQFDSTKASLAVNTIMAKFYMNWFKRAIMAQIIADNIKIVRIHAAGDFFSAEYVEMWKEIIKANPGVLFWTYTKTKFENAFNGFSNANIVKSVVKGFGINFGHCGYIAKLYRALKAAGKDVFLCPCGIKGFETETKCNTCCACAKHEYVLFVEHSTSYDSSKDPDLELIKAILNDQEKELAIAA